MRAIARLLQRHPVFGFFASVRLAVPLMLILCTVVAVGTILESLFTADYAKMAVYQTEWFMGLIALLWVNIFLATLSRWPFSRRHAGFVLTHIGLLTLLAGAMITARWGIDGSLRIVEGKSSSTVTLPDLVVGYQFANSNHAQKIKLERRITAYEVDPDSALNTPLRGLFRINRFLPFASVSEVAESLAPDEPGGGIGLQFRLSSRFFDVSHWLHSEEMPSLSLGPATVNLRLGRAADQPPAVRARAGLRLSVHESGNGRFLGERDVSALRPDWTVGGSRIKLLRRFQFAVVGDEGRLREGAGPEPNPAVEIEIRKGNQAAREVLFSRFAGFALNGEGVFGLRFSLAGDEAAEVRTMPPDHPRLTGAPESASEIDFWVDPAAGGEVLQVVLKSAGEAVKMSELGAGGTMETPWMGMKLTLQRVLRGARLRQVASMRPPARGEDLAPPAVEIQADEESEPFWLSEGSTKDVMLMSQPAQIFFVRQAFELPFSLTLRKFSKTDYPGTDTPMSFESTVELPDGGVRVIGMNEPLQLDGYTLYQSSYISQPGQPTQSIFSVNRDPGRPVKYAGSGILAVGVVLFTLMRTRRFGPRREPSQ